MPIKWKSLFTVTEKLHLQWIFFLLIQNPKNWIVKASEQMKDNGSVNTGMHFYILTLPRQIFHTDNTFNQWNRFFQIASECVILNHTWQNHTWQNPTEEMGGLALACQALSIWLIHCPHMKPWLVRNILPKLNLTFKLFCYCISTSFKNDSFERKKQNTLA